MARNERRIAVATVLVAVLVLAVAGIALTANRQTVATVDEAVTAFRDGQPSPPAAAGAPSSTPPPPDTQAAGTPDPATETPTLATTTEDDAAGPSGTTPEAATTTGATQPARTAAEPPPARQSPAPRPAPTFVPPDEGVYVYATEGEERLEVLGGARHRYPDETTVTVRHADCGYTSRWQPLRERYEEFHICRQDDRAWMRSITLYHEFFEQGMTHRYSCGDHATLASTTAAAGQRWTWECRADGASMHTVIEVLEFATRDVGGERVEAVHVRISNTMEGHTEGTREADVWFHRWSGLELHGTYHTDAMVETPGGRSRYVEDFTRTLKSLRPHR